MLISVSHCPSRVEVNFTSQQDEISQNMHSLALMNINDASSDSHPDVVQRLKRKIGDDGDNGIAKPQCRRTEAAVL